MTDETKAKLLDLYLSPVIPDAIDAHVRAVVEEMRAEPDNRMRVQRLVDANVDVSKERDRLTARVAELEMAVELADAQESGYRSRITELEQYEALARQTEALQARVAELEARIANDECRAWDLYAAGHAASWTDGDPSHILAASYADELLAKRRERFPSTSEAAQRPTCHRCGDAGVVCDDCGYKPCAIVSHDKRACGICHPEAYDKPSPAERRIPRGRGATSPRKCSDCGVNEADPGVTVCTPCWDRVYKRPQAAAPARLDPSGTATGRTILTAPIVGRTTQHAGPASAHVDLETGVRTELREEGTRTNVQTVTGEKSRTYTFPDGIVRIEGVSKLCVRDSGSHRIETADGKKYIVAAGWIAIQVEADAWSF